MNKKYLFLSSLIILLMGAITISALFGTSYAIKESNSLPNNTFSSNKSSVDNINLIKDALNNDNYKDIVENFNVQKNYRTKDNESILYSLMKNLEFPTKSEDFEVSDSNPSDITNKQLLYIMTHGYNLNNTKNNIFTNNKHGEVIDNEVKEYITQIALWLYMYEHQDSLVEYCTTTNIDSGINACSFYNTDDKTLLNISYIRDIISQAGANKDYKYLNYIIELVDEAKSYTYTDPTMRDIANTAIGYTYYDDYITTNIINPIPTNESKANYLDYSVEITDPDNYGVYITDASGLKISNTNDLSKGFRLYIPLKENITDMDLSKIRVSIKGKFLDDIKGYNYKVTSSREALYDNNNQKFADQMIAYVPIKYSYTGFNLRNFVRISQIDSRTGQNLAGATIIIKEKETNKQVAKWVSKEEPHNIILEEGTYQLCDEKAPEGFEKNSDCVEFKVTNNKTQSQTIASVPVPDTFASSKIASYIIGIILFALGGGILLYSFKVNKA